MSWDRGAPTPVVPNAHQARQAADVSGPMWICPCGSPCAASSAYCRTCGKLRPEARALRLQARACQGMGRGGGYFERDDPADRKEVPEDEMKKSDLDIYGRRRSESASTTDEKADRKAERQRAALERLRNPTKRKASLSPPRTRTYRDHTSRSRERKQQKKSQGFILSGGIA
mmetsp:Transcript_23072/g.46727  ORF Transcript_23072/g.46727 Transcript_23072/m.46727 type:complete len:172 (-) Transcript_23072:208-723(-)